MGPGSLIMATPGLNPRRGRDGTYDRIHITVIGEDGTEQTFTLSGSSLRNVDRLAGDLSKRGGVFSPSPSLDLRRITRED